MIHTDARYLTPSPDEDEESELEDEEEEDQEEKDEKDNVVDGKALFETRKGQDFIVFVCPHLGVAFCRPGLTVASTFGRPVLISGSVRRRPAAARHFWKSTDLPRRRLTLGALQTVFGRRRPPHRVQR